MEPNVAGALSGPASLFLPPSLPSERRPYTMAFPTRLLALSLLATLAVSTPISGFKDLVVHETRDVLPAGFALAGPAPPQTPLKLRIALPQSNPEAIIDALYSVSDPSSEKYGQHLSKSEVRHLFRNAPRRFRIPVASSIFTRYSHIMFT